MDSKKSSGSGSAQSLGLSEKTKISESEKGLGMGDTGKDQKPAANPSVSAPRGHTIK